MNATMTTSLQPTGAVFHRCALQVNPNPDGAAPSQAAAIVAKAVEFGVSVLAVAGPDGVAAFRTAAMGQGITVFPGFEMTSSEGIHVLCIYPPDTDEGQLERFLGQFGMDPPVPSVGQASASFENVLTRVRLQGGIAIAAHAASAAGLPPQAWRSEDLLAVRIPGPIEELPEDARRILENRHADYRRVHPAGDKQAVAVINAQEVATVADLENPAATCRIKMSEVSIEGLRQAFLDPDSRIRLNRQDGESEAEAHTELMSLAWDGGFLDGASISLNPNLNVLVGGHGAGKSTIIESLRYVLALDPVGEEAGKAHQGIVRHVLRSGTKVSLRVRCYRPATREYLIERTVPNPPVVRDENGLVSSLLPKDILPRVEVYGQHEISELARSGEKLTRLLDRFAQPDPSMAGRKADLRRDLRKTREALLDVQAELRHIEERLAALPSLEETLERFREVGLEERLRGRSLLVRGEQVMDSIPERLRTFRDGLAAMRQELPLNRVFLSPEALEDLPGRDILGGADRVLERLSNDLQSIVRQLDEALARADAGIAEVRSHWDRHRLEVQAAYEAILRELQQAAVDGEEFIRLRGEIEGLRPLQDRQSLLQQQESEYLNRRRALLAEWEDVKAAEFRALDRAAQNVSSRLTGRVQVEVTAAGNKEPLATLLRNRIGGNLKSTIEKLGGLDTMSLVDLAAACRDGADALIDAYGLTRSQARNVAEAGPDIALRIEELELPPTTTIRLNTAPPGAAPSWQALDALSIGQKATAVLLLLLLESDAPLIVDQPEGDLDNRSITEGIVPRMREEKQRRQFIFSTHNANIPVLGDAELILGLTASGESGGGQGRIAPEHLGSIDTQLVRALVEDILEGGKDAFETRRLKYGF